MTYNNTFKTTSIKPSHHTHHLFPFQTTHRLNNGKTMLFNPPSPDKTCSSAPQADWDINRHFLEAKQ